MTKLTGFLITYNDIFQTTNFLPSPGPEKTSDLSPQATSAYKPSKRKSENLHAFSKLPNRPQQLSPIATNPAGTPL
jgi:hypothetical protein